MTWTKEWLPTRRILPFRTAMESAKGRDSSLVNITAFFTTKSATGAEDDGGGEHDEEEIGTHENLKTTAKTTTIAAEASA